MAHRAFLVDARFFLFDDLENRLAVDRVAGVLLDFLHHVADLFFHNFWLECFRFGHVSAVTFSIWVIDGPAMGHFGIIRLRSMVISLSVLSLYMICLYL